MFFCLFFPPSSSLSSSPYFCLCCAGFSQLCSPRRAFSEQGPLRLIKSASFFSGWRLKLATTDMCQLHACVCVGCSCGGSGHIGLDFQRLHACEVILALQGGSISHSMQYHSTSANDLGQIEAALYLVHLGS